MSVQGEWPCGLRPVPYPAIFGGVGFSKGVVKRKTVVQLKSLRGVVSPPQGSSGVKPLKILDILLSE